MAVRVFVPFPDAPALVRIPLLPLIGSGEDGMPDLVDPLVREGMFLASRQAGAVATGTPGRPLEGRGAQTVRSYTVRARSRPTPHGVFAGVASAPFADHGHCELSVGDGHRARSIPHPAWLAEVAVRVLDDLDVLPSLTLSANNLAVRRGRRLEHEQPAEPGTAGVRRVTVRATEPVTLIMALCARGARWHEVVNAVTNSWPTAPGPSVRRTLRELVRLGFLLTDLLPQDGSDDPLGHLLRKLPADYALAEELSVIRQRLADADRHAPGAPPRLEALTAARNAADGVFVHDRPFSVDVAADTDIVLPGRLAVEAAEAAGVMWRIGSHFDPLDSYHERFVERYGQHRFVPLLDVVDPVVGIGTEATATEPTPPIEVTTVLASLIASAIKDHSIEVQLDAATVEALAGACGSEDAVPPRTAEVYARVIADSPEAATAGRLRLAICPGGHTQDAGSSAGRFVSLLPELRAGGYGDGAIAELAVRARTPTGATLASPAGLGDYRIPLGVPVRVGDLEVDDLLLVSDGHRLSLWSASLNRPITAVLYSRLSSRLLPPIAQLLRALGLHGCRPWRTWSWGSLAGTPFQPRIRYGATILAPARWVLPLSVTEATHSPDVWDYAVEQWRRSTVPPPPAIVVVTDHDRSLPIDLRRADDRALLRRYVRRGADTVTEQPGGDDAVQGVVTGPAGPHALELVMSLARAQNIASPSPRPCSPLARVRGMGDGLHLPGGDWLSLSIRTPVTCQDEVLASVRAIVEDSVAQWFWLRYTDRAGPHLRVRFRADPTILGGRVLPAMAALVTDLITHRLASGYSVEPYEQETERYGGSPETMVAAEQVFITDSQVTLAMVTATQDEDQRLVVAALSAATIARIVAAGDHAALAGRHVDRTARRTLTELRSRTRAAVNTEHTGLVILPTDPAWIARDSALAAYRETLHPARRTSCASSLIHMHVNRILGTTDVEPLARALAADLLFFQPHDPVSTHLKPAP